MIGNMSDVEFDINIVPFPSVCLGYTELDP